MQRSPGHITPTPPIGPVAVRLRLIGQMEAWTLTSESILPTGRKTRALMAIIALSAPRPVLRGKLAEMLWSRRPEEQARASLRQEIHRLLDALDPLGAQVLSITRDHLALRPGAVWVDVEELLRASPARPAALGLYDGELLEGLDGIDPAFDGWLNGERERLSDRARTLAELLLRDQTEPETMIASAQQLLRIDRAHEGAWRALMRAYLARGERGMAIQAYERCRLVLADQLDAQPSAETQRLLSDIRNVVPAKQPGSGETSLLVNGGGGNAGGSNGRPPPPRPPPRPMPRSTVHPLDEPDSPPPGAPARFDPRLDQMRPDVMRQDAMRQDAMRPDAMRQDAMRQDIGQMNGPRTEPGGSQLMDREMGAGEFAVRDPSRSPAPRGGARVGVMPLQLIGTTAAEEHLSTGLADEITSGLAKFRWMFLVTSSSIARFAAQNRDESALRNAFGLDFLLDGVVQRGGDRLRISLRMLDLRGGNQVVWTRRFERNADDLLTLQDEVAAEVVAQIDPEILLIESQRVASRPLADPSAYDLLLRALSMIGRLERPLFMQAGEFLRQAIALEPDWAATHAWYAYWHIFLAAQAWADDPQAGMAEAGRLADRAIALDPQDAKALTIAGHVRAYLHRRPHDGIMLHERALTMNPNLAMAWILSGVAFAYLGDLDEAERRIARYKKLSPLDPQAAFFDTARVVVALLRHDHMGAVDIGRQVTSMNASFLAALKPYLSALGHMRMDAEAAMIRTRLLSLEPDFTVGAYLATSPLDRPTDRQHFAEGLRLAGIQE